MGTTKTPRVLQAAAESRKSLWHAATCSHAAESEANALELQLKSHHVPAHNGSHIAGDTQTYASCVDSNGSAICQIVTRLDLLSWSAGVNGKLRASDSDTAGDGLRQ